MASQKLQLGTSSFPADPANNRAVASHNGGQEPDTAVRNPTAGADWRHNGPAPEGD
ncbi:MAG: hypothetical protein HC838_12370 [Spirulinaceae cyanobacterium RM2_2_10]|nr:hypothetical protein [Spirulinaceae cyanobacterium SM2_1_0]NJO20664.1 hypothetical protein [Spirulinaceae cyanobacterium RM2_2_10]